MVNNATHESGDGKEGEGSSAKWSKGKEGGKAWQGRRNGGRYSITNTQQMEKSGIFSAIVKRSLSGSVWWVPNRVNTVLALRGKGEREGVERRPSHRHVSTWKVHCRSVVLSRNFLAPTPTFTAH